MKRDTVAIVGAGLAGLNCARVLAENEIPFALYEQSETVGGRVQTDVVDGFLLDRGFQVLLAAYPEARRTFDYDRLDLQAFFPGSLVQFRGRQHLVADPFRKPLAAMRGLLSPVGSLADKLKILRLRKRSLRSEIEADYPAQEKSTDEYLNDLGFSKSMRQRFLDPFLRGVHLDPQLQTSSRMTEFVFRMFSTGPTVLPRRGMGALAWELLSMLPPERVHCGVSIQGLNGLTLKTVEGGAIQADHIVLATDLRTKNRLFGDSREVGFRDCLTFYYSADASPLHEKCLMLNGDGKGPINHLCVPSDIAADYSPEGQSLISVSVVEDQGPNMQQDVERQLREWFGSVVESWELLRVDHIRDALPSMERLPLEQAPGYVEAGPNLLVCGDHVTTASIQGALRSGRKCAQRILKFLSYAR